MSWDILIMNSNKPVDFENEKWPNFESREFVISSIKKSFPESNWNDLSEGALEHEMAVIEFNLGSSVDVGNTFMLHVRGGKNPTAVIAKMYKQNSWIAYDISGEKFIDCEKPHESSFNDWESYRNQITASKSTKRKWWKLW